MESAMKCLKYLLLAATLTAAGCSDGGTSKPLVSPDAGAADGGGTTPDGGSTTPDAGAANPDGGGATPDGGATQTLVEFVTDIVKNQTNETALPESIDKTLTDTMDPAAFNALF
jgi:hypothetical protein